MGLVGVEYIGITVRSMLDVLATAGNVLLLRLLSQNRGGKTCVPYSNRQLHPPFLPTYLRARAPFPLPFLRRGLSRFLLPALTLYLPLKAALPAGSFLFAAHHMNLQVGSAAC